MHSGMKFKTVLGDISYDKKGDITRLDYVMYVWKKDASGKITYVECPNRLQQDEITPAISRKARHWAGFFISRSCPAPEKSPAATRSSG